MTRRTVAASVLPAALAVPALMSVGNSADYSKVDASVKVGDLSAGPFGNASGEFISKSLNWSGKGTRTLHVSLGAGDLRLR